MFFFANETLQKQHRRPTIKPELKILNIKKIKSEMLIISYGLHKSKRITCYDDAKSTNCFAADEISFRSFQQQLTNSFSI